jgi:hypothetical protein
MLSKEEYDVRNALREYKACIDEIMNFIAEKKTITRDEKDWLQGLITPLKADIKAAAKRGKVKDDRLPQTQAEDAYFSGAMLRASANFSVATNSHPIRSDWLSRFYNVEMDINQFLCQLEDEHESSCASVR